MTGSVGCADAVSPTEVIAAADSADESAVDACTIVAGGSPSSAIAVEDVPCADEELSVAELVRAPDVLVELALRVDALDDVRRVEVVVVVAAEVVPDEPTVRLTDVDAVTSIAVGEPATASPSPSADTGAIDSADDDGTVARTRALVPGAGVDVTDAMVEVRRFEVERRGLVDSGTVEVSGSVLLVVTVEVEAEMLVVLDFLMVGVPAPAARTTNPRGMDANMSKAEVGERQGGRKTGKRRNRPCGREGVKVVRSNRREGATNG